MQLLFILAIFFAVVAITFAMQNSAAVTVTMGWWHFDSSLAVVLLVSMALGALIAALLSSPKVIAGQVDGVRLRRQIAKLEERNARLEGRLHEMGETLASQPAVTQPVVTQPGVEETVVREVPTASTVKVQTPPAQQRVRVEPRRFDPRRLRTLWS